MATLVSHALCPYVQRVAIVLQEKGIPHERRDIDLGNKPPWFLKLSPTGKTPLLLVDQTALFESSVICEYLEETHGPRLHPDDALDRARHRAWMEYASTVLAAIAAFYSAPDEQALISKAGLLRTLLERVDDALGAGPYFSGDAFSMVDAAFAPALRYFQVVDSDGRFGFFDGLPKLEAWRRRLAARPSVRRAVASDYAERLTGFVLSRDSALSRRLELRRAEAACAL
jgi:glutathione S-transferase